PGPRLAKSTACCSVGGLQSEEPPVSSLYWYRKGTPEAKPTPKKSICSWLRAAPSWRAAGCSTPNSQFRGGKPGTRTPEIQIEGGRRAASNRGTSRKTARSAPNHKEPDRSRKAEVTSALEAPSAVGKCLKSPVTGFSLSM